ncbi:hypothetical protein MD484_g2866, partial [Candolleomyces efflorescens]
MPPKAAHAKGEGRTAHPTDEVVHNEPTTPSTRVLELPTTPTNNQVPLPPPQAPVKSRNTSATPADTGTGSSRASSSRPPQTPFFQALPNRPFLPPDTGHATLNLPAASFLYATTFMYSTSFNQRLTEDCVHPLWNFGVFLMCGGNLGKLQPTAQFKLWRMKNPARSRYPDPDASIATLRVTSNAVLEVIPDFAILYHRFMHPFGSAIPKNFFSHLTFDYLPHWSSIRLTQTFVPLLAELKRPVTRHANDIKQYGYALLQYIVLARNQVEHQAEFLFKSALYRGQKTVILIAACGDYWSFAHCPKSAKVRKGEENDVGRAVLLYRQAEEYERELECDLNLPPKDGLEDGSEFINELSMVAVGDDGDIISDLSRISEDGPDASNVSTTAVSGNDLSREDERDLNHQEQDVPWVYRRESSYSSKGSRGKGASKEKDDDEELEGEDDLVLSPEDVDTLKKRHDDFVSEKGTRRIYSAEDLNEWYQLYHPLMSLRSEDLPSPEEKWQITDEGDLDLAGLRRRSASKELRWSPVLQFGTTASLKALNYISEHLDAFVRYHDREGGYGNVPSAVQ